MRNVICDTYPSSCEDSHHRTHLCCLVSLRCVRCGEPKIQGFFRCTVSLVVQFPAIQLLQVYCFFSFTVSNRTVSSVILFPQLYSFQPYSFFSHTVSSAVQFPTIQFLQSYCFFSCTVSNHTVSSVVQFLHITKTRLFKYTENFTSKNRKFSDKNSDIFHISAQNIDCGYSLEPPR